MTQGQFNVLDALICAQIGVADEQALKIMAALAYGFSVQFSLTASTTLTNLALQVWG